MDLDTYKKKLIKNKQKHYSRIIRNFNHKIRYFRHRNLRKYKIFIQRRNNTINRLRNEVKIIQNLKRKSEKNALLIGINYVGTPNQLYGCINDCYDIKVVLDRYKYKSKLINDYSEIKPTKATILDEIKKLLKNSIYGDTLFLYFSGHGNRIRDNNKDEIDKKDEIIICYDKTFIRDDELQNLLIKHMKFGVKLNIVMDCCNSGTQFDLRFNYNSRVKVNKKCKPIRGNCVLISGCKDNESSYEAYIKNKTSGAFTSVFLKFVRRKMTFRNFMNHIHSKLQRGNYNQKPQLSSGQKLNYSKHRYIL